MATTKEIFEQQLPAKLKAKLDICKAINAVIEFQLAGDGGGNWMVDLTGPSAAVREGGATNPRVTLLMAAPDFVAMMTGTLNAQMAFLTGKLKVKGDMGIALKLGQLLG